MRQTAGARNPALPSPIYLPMSLYRDSPGTPPQDWLDALDRAEADVAAGRLVDGEVIHQDLAAALADMERDEQLDPT